MGFWDYRGVADVDLNLVEKNEVWRFGGGDPKVSGIFQLLPSCPSRVTAALREAME
jgi:hypothetical protein